MLKLILHKGQLTLLICLMGLSTKLFSQSQLTLSVEGMDKSSLVTLSDVAEIIKTRFSVIKTEFFSSVDTAIQEQQILLTFSGWMPSAQQVDFLISARGQLEIYLEGDQHQLLISQHSVDEAEGVISDGLPTLALRLNDLTAMRLSQQTTDAAGKWVELWWDGVLHNRLMVGGPMSKFLTLNVNSEQQAQLMAAVLIGGTLPADIRLTVVPQ